MVLLNKKRKKIHVGGTSDAKWTKLKGWTRSKQCDRRTTSKRIAYKGAGKSANRTIRPVVWLILGYCEKQSNQEKAKQSKITDNRKIRSCLTQISCCPIESFCAREREASKEIEKSKRKRLVLTKNSWLKILRERALERKWTDDRSIGRSVGRKREINKRAYADHVGHWGGHSKRTSRKCPKKVRKPAGIVYRRAKKTGVICI